MPKYSGPILEAKNLYKTFYYPVKTPVLKGINLNVSRGESLAITGRSGEGKSTLLQMLGTFLVWVTQPGDSFQDGNPLLLTTTGEFVLKNLVLIAAAMVVGGKLREGRVP